MTAPAPSAQQAMLRPAHRTPVLIALMTAMALAAMDNTIVSTAIPQVVRDLGGFSLFSWVFSGYLLTQTVTIPLQGRLADQWGRKPVLIGGTIIFLAGSVLCASSWSMVALIFFRGLQGIGAGGVQATVNTLAGDLYDLEERGRVQGWLSSVWGISAVIGPVLGGSLAQYASWRWIFLINLPVGAAAVALLARYLHEDVHRTRHRIDVAGAAAMFVAAGALILGLLQGGVAWPWWSVPSVTVFAVAVVAAVGAVFAERRAAEPIMPPWFWRRRVLTGSALAALGLGLLVIGPTTFLPTYGQAVLGLGAVAAGAVLGTMSLGWPLASSQSARLFLRAGFRDTQLVGAGICLVSVAAFLLAPDPAPLWQPVLETFVLGAGLGLLSVASIVGPQSTVGWGERGVVTGTVMFCRYLGQSLGAAIFGAIFNASLSGRLRGATEPLRRRLPHEVSSVGAALGRPQALGRAAEDYLRAAIATATRDVYIGLTAVAALTIIGVLLIMPRRFSTAAGGTASAGPGDPGPAEPAEEKTG
ncbi:MAG TPA: MFS transporter [Streptosporangiaceae bacterium]|nr:MFS transporter [Streptosporangiaceae bacterium]